MDPEEFKERQKFLELFFEQRRNAAFLQLLRVFQARARFLDKRAKIIKIQRAFRAVLQRREFLRVRRATILIQTHWRIKRFKRRKRATLLIQERFRFIRLRQLARVLQARFRYLDKIAKIVKIQRCWRRFCEKKADLMVTNFQACVRGYLSRRAAKAKSDKKAAEEEKRRREKEVEEQAKREAGAEGKPDEEKAVQEDGEDKRREEEDKERADRAAEAEKKAPIREDEDDKEPEEMRGGYFGGEELSVSPRDDNDEPVK